MDIIAFYKSVEQNLRKAGNGLFEKFKLTNADLVSAVMNNDPAAVAESLNAWVNPNKIDGLGRYPLPIAVDNNHELIVGMLLHHKANPDVRGAKGESALYKAVFWENENMVRLLMEKGASAYFPNLDGKTPIQVAKENNYSNIHAILTNDKEQLKRMQLARDKATHIAMKERAQDAKAKRLNSTLMAESEIKIDNDINQSKNIETFKTKYATSGSALAALLSAIKDQDSEAVRYFAGQVEDLNSFIEGENALLIAIESGKEKLAQYLQDQGAKLFIKNSAGNYPILNKAVQHQLYELLEKSCTVEEFVADKLNDVSQSFSAPFLAYKDPKMMDILLKYGADPFFGGKDGVSPIIKAIEKGSIAILPVLSKHNVDFGRKIDGKLLLHWAIELKRADWVNGLLTENALTNLSDADQASLLDIAQKTEDTVIINLMTKFE